MNRVNWYQDDALFFKELQEGHEWETRVGKILEQRGLQVIYPQKQLRTEAEKFDQKWTKETDLILVANDRHFNLEVKSRRSARFTGPNDIPQALLPFIVNSVHRFDSRATKPLATVIICRETSGIVVIPTATKPAWTTINRYDQVIKMHRDFYAAPRSCLMDLETFVEQYKRHIATGS